MKNKIKLQLFFLAVFFLLGTHIVVAFGNDNKAKNTRPEQLKDKVYPGEFSLSSFAFTENKGQVHDQNYRPRPDVLFGASDGKLNMHIKNTGISYQLNKVDSYKEEENPITHKKEKRADKISIYRIDLYWINHNTSFTQSTDEAVGGVSNYYLENCPNGVLNVKSYKGVTLHNLYTGINLHYYEKNGQLKHDYIVAPHANYKQIQLEVYGAEVIIDKDGSLNLFTPLGKVQEGAPIVYQNGKQLIAKWIISKTDSEHSRTKDGKPSRIISFEIENYKPNYELIIDPVTRIWGTYYGGSNQDWGYACTSDASGNGYLGGWTELTTGTVIATTGGHQNAIGGNQDAFLIKFNGSGVRQWGTYYGGSGNDIGRSCSADGSGNVYLGGITNSNTGTVIATAGAHQSTHGGGNDAFLVKFDASGVRQWGTYYGGSGTDEGLACTSDGSGNIYLGGLTNTNTGTVIATIGAHQSTYGGAEDAFLVKFNAAGVRQWGTYYGGSAIEYGYACSSDAVGNVYLAGLAQSTTGTVIATAGAHQTTYGGINDAFLAKFNSAGVRQWGTYYGGGLQDWGFACTNDPLGNVYLAGWSQSASGTEIATSGSHQTAMGGIIDAYLVKFDANGIRQWGTYYGGSGQDEGHACSSDANGNVYLVGITNTNTGTVIATTGAHQSTHGGAEDAFMVKFNASGVRQWGTYYGGSAIEYGYACSSDAVGNVYLAGLAQSTTSNVIATTGAHQTAFGGINDAFLVKLTDCVALTPTAAVNSTICAGATLNFTASITGTTMPTFSWSGPNTFTSNLQNPTIANAGNINIGVYTVTVNNSGCIETTTTQVTTVNVLPTVAVNSGTICSGNSFTILPSGANAYTIQGGNSVVSPTASVSYTVIGTSTEGCLSSNTATSHVIVNVTPTVSVNSGSVCSGSNFTITPIGASTYTIQGGNAVVSPTANASYTVIGTSIAGCVSANTATCNISVNVTPTITVNSGSICYGNSFTISPSGASTYTIQGGNAVVSPITNSTYSVAGTSSLGCLSASAAVSSVTVHALPVISVNSGSICSGQSFTMSPSGASTYTYSSGNAVVSPITNSSYSVTGTSSLGCLSASAAVSSVNVHALPVISVNSGSICSGQSFTISPSGASTYTIQGGNTVVSPTTNTSYTVNGTSTAGCISSNVATANITVNALPNVNASSNNSIICVGQSVTLSANGALNYTWSPAIPMNSVVSPSTTITYTVIGEDTNGCQNTGVVTQNVDPCLGISQPAVGSGQLTVYPNPNTGAFFIESTQAMDVIIYDALGKLILQRNLIEGKNQVLLNEAAKGIYFIQVNQNGIVSNIKIIKE